MNKKTFGAMAMHRWLLFFITLLIFTASILWYRFNHHPARESITYFPIHPELTIREAKTEILTGKGQKILLRSYSHMDTPVFLRQDITMLFANGKLVAKMGKWQQNVKSLAQSQKVTVKDNTKLHALSFHHAEIHENSAIRSTQQITDEIRYLIGTDSAEFITFKNPVIAEERLWKEMLDKKEERVISSAIDTIAATYSLDLNHFDLIPLFDLAKFMHEPLPSFSMRETKIIIGQLIEGLYKNFFLGIKKEDGSTVSPINSTVPIIFLAKNREFLYVSFITADGDVILLRQNISV